MFQTLNLLLDLETGLVSGDCSSLSTVSENSEKASLGPFPIGKTDTPAPVLGIESLTGHFLGLLDWFTMDGDNDFMRMSTLAPQPIRSGDEDNATVNYYAFKFEGKNPTPRQIHLAVKDLFKAIVAVVRESKKQTEGG